VPELPEVETVCWRLREGGHGEPALVGRTLRSVVVDDPHVLRAGDVGAVVGARVVDVRRRGKWIVVATDRPHHLVVHLVMTGDLHVLPAPSASSSSSSLPAAPPASERFVRWHARLDDGTALVFSDRRRLGHLDVVVDPAPLFADLGPEPLDDAFTAAALHERLGSARALKTTLLDGAVVAGLGNIWADEVLHAAGLDPRLPARTLDDDDVARLHQAMRRTLARGIDDARQALAWRYENRAAPSPFLVYDRGGEPCRGCTTKLSSTKLAGRTTVWCPRCQPARR
jgi:formamidopyrimidine-DNA glycosylase